MNRKVNTVVFFIVATIANIAIILVLFVGLLLVFSRFLAPHLPEDIVPLFMMIIFFGSIAASFFLYNKAIKVATNRFKLEQYLSPLFQSRKKPT